MINSLNITFGSTNNYRCLVITSGTHNEYAFGQTDLGLADVSAEIYQKILLTAVLMSGSDSADHRGRMSIELPKKSFTIFDQMLKQAVADGSV